PSRFPACSTASSPERLPGNRLTASFRVASELSAAPGCELFACPAPGRTGGETSPAPAGTSWWKRDRPERAERPEGDRPVPPEVVPLVRATARAFQDSYPDASIRVVARGSREAMGDVFANRADLAVVGREIEQVERQTATEARIDMEAYRWAWDGVAAVVHPS